MTASASDRVRIIRAGQTYIGKQGFTYGAGASAETVGAKGVCMNIMPIPRGQSARAHYRKGIETIGYLLEGTCAVYFGDELECRVSLRAGEQIFIPPDVPHAASNEGDAPCTWIVVHSSGSDQDGIVLLPELDAVTAAKMPAIPSA
jgi:uncharacterized RmlC-like cupin family protein